MEEQGINRKQVLSAAGFLTLAFLLFVCFTNIFREAKPSQRLNVLSYQMEEKDTMDAVFIGASSFYRFWDPMCAYGKEGIVTFNYSCASLCGTSFKAAIREVLRTQHPKLLVLDARRLTSSKIEAHSLKRARFYIDALDFGISRFRAVKEFGDYYNRSFKTLLPFYLDLMLYHENYSALTDPLHLELWDNRVSENTPGLYIKGYGMASKVKRLKHKTDYITDECAPMKERAEQLYREICEECQKLDTEVLFLVTPFAVKKDRMVQFNELERIAGEYGIPFVNLNSESAYAEMGMDFSTDFYNANHTNVSGAKHFSEYFATYLKEHYDLPDRREDPSYASWEEDYQAYCEKAEIAMKKVNS